MMMIMSESFEKREPILDIEGEKAYPAEVIETQWQRATEVVKQDLPDNPELRQALLPVMTTPVSEVLPGTFLRKAAEHDPRLAKLLTRYTHELGNYTALPSVPEEAIGPNLTNASQLLVVQEVKRNLEKLYPPDSDTFRQRMEIYIKTGSFTQGITPQEKALLLRRYRMARDTKIIALGAEILHEGGITMDDHGEAHLPSGTVIQADLTQKDTIRDILTPHLWEHRRELKDRVHTIGVNGKEYLLKERRTSRHKDTHGDHPDVRSSADEFAVAQLFQEKGAREEDNVRLQWERPLGYVTYPDGFQFSVFETEQNLIDEQTSKMELAKLIDANPDQFMEEFHRVRDKTAQFYDRVRELSTQKNRSRTELTFAEFARVKSLRLHRYSRELMHRTIAETNYKNKDIDGIAFRPHIDSKSGKVTLQIVGFDFEHFEEVTPQEATESFHHEQKNMHKQESRWGVHSYEWTSGEPVSAAEDAAYFALLDDEGILQKI